MHGQFVHNIQSNNYSFFRFTVTQFAIYITAEPDNLT